jgi:hypothetical protein
MSSLNIARKKKKTGKLTCRSYLSECRRWSSDRWKSLCLSASFFCVSQLSLMRVLSVFSSLFLCVSLCFLFPVFSASSLCFFTFSPHSLFSFSKSGGGCFVFKRWEGAAAPLERVYI